MLNATHVAHEAKTSGGKYAFAAKDVSSDFAALSKKRDATVTGLTKGIEFLFKKNKIDYIHALARITEDAEGLKLSGSNTSVDGETLRPKNIILATGSVPSQMPGGILAFDGKRVISSDGLMTLQSVPKRLVIVGGKSSARLPPHAHTHSHTNPQTYSRTHSHTHITSPQRLIPRIARVNSSYTLVRVATQTAVRYQLNDPVCNRGVAKACRIHALIDHTLPAAYTLTHSQTNTHRQTGTLAYDLWFDFHQAVQLDWNAHR